MADQLREVVSQEEEWFKTRDAGREITRKALELMKQVGGVCVCVCVRVCVSRTLARAVAVEGRQDHRQTRQLVLLGLGKTGERSSFDI